MRIADHGMHDRLLEALRAFLGGVPKVCAAYLHGSVMTGSVHPGSDVDLALLLLPGSELSVRERILLAAELEAIVQRPVDLGILNTRNLVFCKEVICKGSRVFVRDRTRSDLFAAHALSMYADLQQQRKEVLDAYAA